MLTTTIGTGGDAEASTFASAITRWRAGEVGSASFDVDVTESAARGGVFGGVA